MVNSHSFLSDRIWGVGSNQVHHISWALSSNGLYGIKMYKNPDLNGHSNGQSDDQASNPVETYVQTKLCEEGPRTAWFESMWSQRPLPFSHLPGVSSSFYWFKSNFFLSNSSLICIDIMDMLLYIHTNPHCPLNTWLLDQQRSTTKHLFRIVYGVCPTQTSSTIPMYCQQSHWPS